MGRLRLNGLRGWLFAFALLSLLGSGLTFGDGNGNARSAASDSPSREVERGKSLFQRDCGICHGMGGAGGRGPRLNRPQIARAPDEATLRALIASGIPPEMPPGTFLTSQDVSDVVAYVLSLRASVLEQIVGDSARGASLFTQYGCIGCHIFRGKGLGYGPDLTDIGQRRSPEYVRLAILLPTAHLPSDFLLVRVTTAVGSVVDGIRANEDTFTIQLKDREGGFQSFRKSDLKNLEKLRGVTPMPTFEGVLNSAAVQDIVAYLMSGGQSSSPVSQQ